MSEPSSANLDIGQGIYLLMTILPPPVSLDILCSITGHPPVEVLQIVEEMVKSSPLSRYKEKGMGYYYFSDFKIAREHLQCLPESLVHETAQKAIKGLLAHNDDGAKLWLSLAHVYQVSGLPLTHFKETVNAGHYCRSLNLPADAAEYYRMALEAMSRTVLSPDEQRAFIDAAIGVCTCRDTELSKDIQRKYLEQALVFSNQVDDPERRVRLNILIAKTFIKTIHSDEAEKFLERAWQMISKHHFPAEIRMQVGLASSELLFWQGYITRAIERYEAVIGNHEELPLDMETLKSSVRLAWTYGVAGETARGIGLLKGVRKKAKEMGAADLERYATLVLVIILSDAGRIEEGELYLKEVFNVPEELLDNYTLWPGNGKRAYFAFLREDYDTAYKYLSQAWENSQELGTPHHRGPDNLTVMLGLESRGMGHPHWTFESDIERLISWPDAYMKGVAYRFRALKAAMDNAPVPQIEADLKKSIALLDEVGAKIELSHAQIQLAQMRIGQSRTSGVESYLKPAWEIFSKVNPNLFPKDLKPYLDQTSKNALWVESLLELGDVLSSIRTREELLSQIIKHAMRIAGAERGAIFLRQDQKMVMVVSRNIDRDRVGSTSFLPQMDLIEQVFESGEEVIRLAWDWAHNDDEETDIRGWTGCLPIRLKSKVMGVILMDRGVTHLQLPEDEVSLLRIICNQAAVALENMEAYEEIYDLKTDLEAETRSFRKGMDSGTFSESMVGRSEPFKDMLNMISRVAGSDTTVMITGETGVGKELVAQSIHRHSSRSSGPFIGVNVVSLSPELMASELFGHEKGAFTGASFTRKGRFELASNGTLFLDDIDAFSLDIQAKLLRVLENKEFERVGGTKTLKTRFRLVAASNRNIGDLVKKGLFRSDFYFRLNVFPIRIPPLRERADDIPELVRYFVAMFARKFSKDPGRLSQKDLALLQSYHWPGNIRELRHVIERAVLLSRKGRLVIPPLDTSWTLQRMVHQVARFRKMGIMRFCP